MGKGSKKILEELEERVKTLVRLRPSHREILEFYGALLKEQLKARGKIQREMTLEKAPTSSQEDEEGPLLRGRKIPIDYEAAGKLFRSLCRVAKGRTPILKEGIEKIERATREGRIDMDRFLGEMALSESRYLEEVSSSIGLNRDILTFLGRASIQPFLIEAAAILKEGADLKGWSENMCPVCGAPPLLSELAETEGRRMLICSICGHRWKGVRTVCPFCHTQDPKAHRYLFVEGDESVRIDVCEVCKKYIKTIDSRKMSQRIFPLLEDMGTIHLDMLAQGEGYQRGSTPFLEIS